MYLRSLTFNRPSSCRFVLAVLLLFAMAAPTTVMGAGITDVDLWFTVGNTTLKNPRNKDGSPRRLWMWSGKKLSVQVVVTFDRMNSVVAALYTEADLYEADHGLNPDDPILGLVSGPNLPPTAQGGVQIETVVIGPLDVTLTNGGLQIIGDPGGPLEDEADYVEILSKHVRVGRIAGDTWEAASAAFKIHVVPTGGEIPTGATGLPEPSTWVLATSAAALWQIYCRRGHSAHSKPK